ncbi:MAG: siroheme synthase CysG [Actinomycetota bacterium]
MPFRYQIALELQGRRCVVIGGGRIGEHKVQALLDADASVTVISNTFTLGLRTLAEDRSITLIERSFEPGDLEGAFLAIAATDDARVNQLVFEEAERSKVLLNTVDDIERSHFAVPAIVRRGELRVAISTGGKAPALAKRLRMHLEREIGPEWEELIDVLGEAREDALPRTVSFEEWAARWQRALDLDLLGMIRDGRGADARRAIDECLAGLPRSAKKGHVSLVGAGPGDPDLITVKGRKALEQADVIVHDRLAHFALQPTPLIDVGKRGGAPSFPQSAINDLLIALAEAGLNVVRLKGGDPFVFGRGGEEVSALRAAGIPCEVIPAPTSAIAVPAAAGIPVTDRRAASSFAVVTGHEVDSIDWSTLGADTLVVLMGARNVGSISRALIDAGRDASTPAAVIADGTLPTQRVVIGDLDSFSQGSVAPSPQPQVLVVGDVVSLADESSSSIDGGLVALIAPAGHAIDASIFTHSVTLATCERTEVYGITDQEVFVEGVEVLRGRDAERHLLRVASGLCSRVIGERQILGQVRRALKDAKPQSTAGPVLSDLFARAIVMGRKVRVRTALGSVKHGIGALVRDRLGDIQGQRVVVIGTGEAGIDIASVLNESGARLSIVGRDSGKARVIADRFDADAFELSALDEALREASIAVVAVSGKISLHALRDEPLRVIDVSVPSAVEAAEGIVLETIGDLRGSTDDLREAIEQAERMIEDALDADAERAVRALHVAADDIVAAEVRRVLEHVHGTADAEAIATAGKRIATKLLHGPTVALRNDPGRADEVLAEVFQLNAR